MQEHTQFHCRRGPLVLVCSFLLVSCSWHKIRAVSGDAKIKSRTRTHRLHVAVTFAGRSTEEVSFRIRSPVQQIMWASNTFETRQTFLHHLIYFTLYLCFVQFSGMEEKSCCLLTWQSRQFSPSSRSFLHPGPFSALSSLLLGWDKVPIIRLHLCSVLLFFYSLIITFAVLLTCNVFQKFFYFCLNPKGQKYYARSSEKFTPLWVWIFSLLWATCYCRCLLSSPEAGGCF